MLDPAFIRKFPDVVRKGFADKGESGELDWYLQLDKDHRAVLTEKEQVAARQNQLSKLIGMKTGKGEDSTPERAEADGLKAALKLLEERDSVLKQDKLRIQMRMPNLAADDVPVGKTPEDNTVAATWGEKPTFDFTPKPHWEIGAGLGAFHAETAGKISGAGFSLMTGPLAQLERALWNYMLDLHTREHGYTEVAVPYMVKEHALEGCGQLPKFEPEMYRMKDDDLFLIPTAEVPLTNIHRQEILAGERLPIRYCAFSPCFRREAGAAGRDTRGLIRMHQFHKVELMVYTTPEDGDAEQMRIRTNAEAVLRNLKLPYRVLLLCTGDMSVNSRRTWDLELWAPGVGAWLEVSSISTFGDFQARRSGIRFKRAGKTEYVHTLNGSGVALPRLVIAILENYQRADGSVVVPDVLRPCGPPAALGPLRGLMKPTLRVPPCGQLRRSRPGRCVVARTRFESA
ncbi:MAG: serine--tRNA ligase [Planctomycetes bacterium]|nr:serine--tRNA ligase [Planctomycetota bacterium]